MVHSDLSFFKAEFHVHTRFSQDSILPIRLLLLKCKILGIRTLAITDHNTISGAVAAQEFAPSFGVKIIVGEEIFTSQGEIIGLFLTEAIPAGLTAYETVVRIHQQGGIVWIPHPYDEKRCKTVLEADALANIQNLVHAIEAYNGRNVNRDYGQKQEKIANWFNGAKVVGSDAHSVWEIGRNFAYLPQFDSPASFLSALDCARWQKKRCIWWIHLYTKIIRVLRKKRG